MDMPQNETYENQNLLDVDGVGSVSFLLRGSIKLDAVSGGNEQNVTELTSISKRSELSAGLSAALR